jgi:hypothetical protein
MEEHEHGECEPPSDKVVIETDEKIAFAIKEALDARFPNHGPHMVAQWQLSAVVIANDGERYNWSVDPHDARVWETMGLLSYAMAILNGRVTKSALEEY